ncbi:MAG: ABC transporter substrate-binding protein [Myxococcota bacterium]|jgi:phospholipid transport system substrate-binding protein|nr:ABC transporter substrate-binding protein [Myxococcota bacterium]
MRRSISILVFAFSLVSLAVGATASAQAPTEAQRFLQDRNTTVMRLMERPASTSRDTELTRMLGELLDYEELSRRALARHWDERSPAERAEFVGILKQLVERSYRSNLQRTLRYEVRYETAEARGSDVLVQTEARNRQNRRAPAVSIDYLVVQRDGAWRIVDITVDDGMSMVDNYRNQFERILRREGWDGLMTRMRGRLTEEAAE